MPKQSGEIQGELPKAALIVAHPPHILTLYGWMNAFRPLVHVLTDGQVAQDSTAPLVLAQTLRDCGATPGELFAERAETSYFAALLLGDTDFFVGIAQTLTASLIQHEVAFVVADAEEGYNSTHDICRALADAAVDAAIRLSGRQIVSYACHQTEWTRPVQHEPDGTWLQYALDSETFSRKQIAASRFMPWSVAIAEALEGSGQESFRTERLAPARGHRPDSDATRPYYETYGERQAAAGKYTNVIRYQEHVRPVCEALRAYANGERP